MQCVFHKEEYITNFCQSEQCLLPLCPVCVKLHSEEHLYRDRRGVFELIDTCVVEAHKELKQQLDSLAQCRSKSNDLATVLRLRESELIEELREARARIQAELEARFDQF
jgi:hypothetical protein